jgi:hypothetical protein
MDELRVALERCHNTFHDPDSIRNEVLSHLHLQASSFDCPYTIAYGPTARYQVPGEKLLQCLFWKPAKTTPWQVVIDR